MAIGRRLRGLRPPAPLRRATSTHARIPGQAGGAHVGSLAFVAAAPLPAAAAGRLRFVGSHRRRHRTAPSANSGRNHVSAWRAGSRQIPRDRCLSGCLRLLQRRGRWQSRAQRPIDEYWRVLSTPAADGTQAATAALWIGDHRVAGGRPKRSGSARQLIYVFSARTGDGVPAGR